MIKIESHTIFHGDVIQLIDQLENESVDMVFADPPFNLNKKYHKNVIDLVSEEDYLKFSKEWIELCASKLKKGGSFYLYNIPKWNIKLSNYLSDAGLTFRNWITVEQTNRMPIRNRLYPSHYSLLYYVKGDQPNVFNPPRITIDQCRHCNGDIKDYGGHRNKLNPNGLNLSDVWNDIPVVRHKTTIHRQENQLSLKLLDRVIDISTKEGDIILDPFQGSGTTLIASELKNRICTGFELGEVETVLRRFENIQVEKSQIEKYWLLKNRLTKAS